MKKNFFSNAVALAAIMLAGLSLNSCDEKDNAIIDGKVWVKPEVKLIDGGAIVTASSPDDISRMIGRVRQEMAAAAQNGETFTLDIDAPVLNATSSDNTISIPTINGGDVGVNFKSAISTEAPLVLESKGVADDAVSTPKTNKVEINIPSTSNADLKINMPFTTVTLNAASGSLNIDELIAKTATNTLIIGKGVTVNWLQLKGGNAVVKEGGKVLGAIADNVLDVFKKGVLFGGVWNNEIPEEEPTEDDYYYVQNAKVIKAESPHQATIYLYGSEDEEQENVPEVTISDGAYAWVLNKTDMGEQPTFVNITGEGNANIMVYGADFGSGPNFWCEDPTCLNLTWVNKLTNVSVDYSKWLKYDFETSKVNEAELDEDLYTEIYLPINSENCTFKAKRFLGAADRFSEDIVLSTHKGSTFDNLKNENNYLFTVVFPEQSKDRKTFNLSFDSCEFEQAGFITRFSGADEKFDGFKAYMTFDNSKVGGKAITKDTEMITNVENREYDEKPVTSTFFVIDGVTYTPVHVVEPEDQWTLVEVE